MILPLTHPKDFSIDFNVCRIRLKNTGGSRNHGRTQNRQAEKSLKLTILTISASWGDHF
jgi:hypothetical protein